MFKRATETAQAKAKGTTADHIDAPQSNAHAPAGFADNRPAAVAQRQRQAAISNSPRVRQTASSQALIVQSPRMQQVAQRQEATTPERKNNTGLPDKLKAGVENLSGHSLDDVRVHYNSDKPAELQAHAYAQGKDIHVAPRQERHLPHEAWHVIQQKQGRVQPTMQLKGEVNVNDDDGLEKEADKMGAIALQRKAVDGDAKDANAPGKGGNALPLSTHVTKSQRPAAASVAQLALPASLEEWAVAHDATITAGGATAAERTIFGQLHYIVELVKPFLETRYDYIAAKEDHGDDKVASFRKRLVIAAQLYRKAIGPATVTKFKEIEETYKTNSLISLIQHANRLPTTLEEVEAHTGGYKADNTIRAGMPALGRTLNHLARGISDGSPVPLSPAPAATAAKATKAVPRMSKDTFMSSEGIPIALRRLVMDIYLHWKSRKVMDTRTTTQKAERAKTPDQTGALRTYHMNEHATIPALPGPYAGDHPLHQHYVGTSQGSSVHGGNPYGFAEYTGIDSDQNKIVLDYVNGNIYITSTHYKHWFDTGADVIPESGDITSTRSKIGGSKTEANLQSPWVKIDMN